MVEEFNKEMDPKNNGYVKFKEFSAYKETIGCQHLSSDEFFNLLKQPRHEELYIEDQKAFCGGKCRKFVTGMYFTCVKCFDGSGSTFSVCPQCFAGEQYKHEHKEFLCCKIMGRSWLATKPQYERSTSSTATVVKNSLPASPASSSSSSKDKPDPSSFISNSIVPAVNQQSKQAKMQTAIQFGQLVASIGGIVVASQLCTIM
ncbi:hypothetical protein UlMin_010105 [Ulmus minor]